MTEPIFKWEEEIGLATCILKDTVGKEYIGLAQCHPEDEDMKSRHVGQEIALIRAEIAYAKHVRDNELKPGLAALNHYYSTVCLSNHFSNDSYEIKRLLKEIHNLKNNLNTINNFIAVKREEVNSYITEKDKMYKRIRSKRVN